MSQTDKERAKFLKLTEKWNERNFKYIDVIVSSGEIRRQFFKRCKELEIDPYRVAIAAGYPISVFKKNYVNNPDLFALEVLTKLSS